MKRKIILWIFVLLMLGAGGVYYFEFYLGAKHKDPSKSEDQIVIKATELYAQYMKDEAGANTHYLDSVICVSGVLENMELNEGRYTLTLTSGDSSGAVICEMDMADNEKVKTLKAGNEITLIGFCNGLLMDVQLDRCKLKE